MKSATNLMKPYEWCEWTVTRTMTSLVMTDLVTGVSHAAIDS